MAALTGEVGREFGDSLIAFIEDGGDVVSLVAGERAWLGQVLSPAEVMEMVSAPN